MDSNREKLNGLEKKFKRLDGIVNSYHGLERNHIGNFKRAFYFIPFVWLAGSFTREFQEEYMEKMRFKKENAKYLTIANAAVFGIGVTLLEYYGAGGASNIVQDFDFFNHIREGVLSNTANFLGITSKALGEFYVKGTLAYSMGRIFYSGITKKAIFSPSPMGFIGTGIKKLLKYRREKTEKACGGS